MLTVFANIRINSENRLQHLKDSFKSFSDISDNWLINVRGQYRNQTIKYLASKLNKKMVLFELLDDNRGWMNNSLEMVKKAKHDYVLNWNEDHINLAEQELYPKIIKSMKKVNADYMGYTWWFFGKPKSMFENLTLKKGKYIDSIRMTPEKWSLLRNKGHKSYLISSTGIFKKSLFIKMLKKDSHKFPVKVSYPIFGFTRLMKKLGISIDEIAFFGTFNKIFGNKLARYPKVTPHELEKDPFRTDLLPITIALPKHELFACIDDNNGVNGYSLISRNLYKPAK